MAAWVDRNAPSVLAVEFAIMLVTGVITWSLTPGLRRSDRAATWGWPATKEIKDEVARLRSELNRHGYLYYVEANPEVSDREYDQMMLVTELKGSIPSW